jgi:DNA repair protein RecO
MQITTPAIVLNAVDFKESSQIVTLFCLQGGVTTVLAKGAKTLRSKFFGKCEPGNRIEAVIAVKPGRDIQILVDASLSGSFSTLWTQPGLGALVYNTLELAKQMMQQRQEQPEMFVFLDGLFRWASVPENKATMKLFPYIQVRLSDLYGIGMDLSHIAPCFSVETGSFGEEAEGPFRYILTPAQQLYVRCITNRRSAELVTIEMSAKELNGLIHMFDVYLRHHIDHLQPRRSAAIFEQLDAFP